MYVFVALVLLLVRTRCDSAFRVGAVLSTKGSTKEMEQAKNGYALFFDAINERNGGQGFLVEGRNGTKGYWFRYAFLSREDASDFAVHQRQLDELMTKEKIHFLGGSHLHYDRMEVKAAVDNGVLLYKCCVDAKMQSHDNSPFVFVIRTSKMVYTHKFLAASVLAGSLRYGFVVDVGEPSFMYAYYGALALLQETSVLKKGVNNITYVKLFNSSEAEPTAQLFREVARAMKHQRVDSLIAAVNADHGKHIVNALHEAQYSLKSTFIMRGPTDQEWVDAFEDDNRVERLVSTVQWHEKQNDHDDFFGKTAVYVDMYTRRYGEKPTSYSAGASAVGATLTQAIQNAFAHCDISKTHGDVDTLLYSPEAIDCEDDLGDRGYDRVLASLQAIDMQTFFGFVKFDRYRRNLANKCATTQVFVTTSANGAKHRDIEVVLPVGVASHEAVLPAKNYYKEVCMPGTFVGPDDFNPCVECSEGEASYEKNAPFCDSCPVGEWRDKKGGSSCNTCPEGTTTAARESTNLSDCICKVGYFNAAGETGVACDPCPVGALCPGGTELPIPLQGYWANETRRSEIYACDDASVCTGGNGNACRQGHTGRMCAQCEDGYFNALNGCHRCLDRGVIVFLSVALLVGWYVINVTVSRSVTSLEMMLGWAQLANIIGDINLNWTQNVTTMFGVANLLDFDVDILEPGCVVEWGFRANFITQLLLPFVMSTMAASGYLLSAAVHLLIRSGRLKLDERTERLLSVFVVVSEDGEQLKAKWDATVATFLSAVDVTYVTIAKYCFDVFRCEEIAGVSVLRESPDVLCGDFYHLSLKLLSVSGIVFYVVGYLVYLLWKLYDLRTRCAFADAANLRRLGFVYQKFELDYYFTPAVIIVRKLLFVLVLVYVNNPAFQIGAIAVVIIASLMVHVYTAPYVDTYLDVLFSFLLIALMCEAFGGLMFYSENLPNDDRRILEIVVLTSNLLVVGVFMTFFVIELIKKYHVRYITSKLIKFARDEIETVGCLFLHRLSSRKSPASSEASVNHGSDKDDSTPFDLLDTFNPRFVHNALKKKPSLIKDWDTVSRMLKNYMSDQSESSYLSMNPVAKFWRKLVDRFPELVDFLAVADDETRDKFEDVAKCLFRDFYLTNKVIPLPLMDVLNWRDYAPMSQWLAIADDSDRAFFFQTVAQMFKNNGNHTAAGVLMSKIRNGRYDPDLHGRGLRHLRSLSHLQQSALSSLKEGLHPFTHSAYRRSLDPDSLVNRRISDFFEALSKESSESSRSPTPSPNDHPSHKDTDADLVPDNIDGQPSAENNVSNSNSETAKPPHGVGKLTP